MQGRDVTSLLDKLERIAVANEKLIYLATEERSIGEAPGPPFCPHCSTVNPKVSSEGGSAPMADFILVARCGNCGGVIFAVPEGWIIKPTQDEALAALEGRTT